MSSHQKDIKEYPDSRLGESRYDNLDLLIEERALCWERYYYEKLYSLTKPKSKNGLTEYSSLEIIQLSIRGTKYDYRDEALGLENKLGLPQDVIVQYRRNAEEYAQREKDAFASSINKHRKDFYYYDLEDNAIYSSVICLALSALIICILNSPNMQKTK